VSQALYVQCGLGLEATLVDELRELGLPGGVAHVGGVEIDGPDFAYERVNLWSRIANRVMLRVGEIRTSRELQRLELGRFGQAFQVEVLGDHQRRFSDGVQREVRSAKDGVGLSLRVLKDVATVSVDTSGELLYFRGYRQEVGRAPMRESLAAGLLRLSKWAPPEPLWDVMCGSGTIIIEAAEMAAGLAPGRSREFAFQRFPSHQAARFAALERSRPAVGAVVTGSDLNSGALGTARRNAKRAGVLERLTLERVDATKLPAREPRGLIIANLPYGKRVGERSELATLYKQVGAAVKRCAGWRFAFFLEDGVEHLELEVETQLRVANGGLSCLLIEGRC
jgi:putative N6-adenine-specific DNA methylase